MIGDVSCGIIAQCFTQQFIQSRSVMWCTHNCNIFTFQIVKAFCLAKMDIQIRIYHLKRYNRHIACNFFNFLLNLFSSCSFYTLAAHSVCCILDNMPFIFCIRDIPEAYPLTSTRYIFI